MSGKESSKLPKSLIDCCAEGCFLCNEINDHNALSRYLGLYADPLDKIITQSEHFIVIHDICPIVPGHALLIAREHKLSMAQIPCDWYEELAIIKQEAVFNLSKRYRDKPFCFEHGAAVGHVASGISIEHAHLHLIPAKPEIVLHIEDWVQAYIPGTVELRPVNITQVLSKVISSYLYYEDSKGDGFLLCPDKPIPDQFIRRVVANSYGLSKWDWKEIALPHLLRGSLMTIPQNPKLSSEPAHKLYRVDFWPGFQAEIDLSQITHSAIPVKGKLYKDPLRFLEIFANFPYGLPMPHQEDLISWLTIEQEFIPRIPGVNFALGENIPQPPFTWKECSGYTLSVNFTYNTNAIYRIISNLNEQKLIPTNGVDNLVDRACLRLASIYRAKNSFVMRNMNNNFNMFLISKVVESLLGKSIYNSEIQEYLLTHRSLQIALGLARDYVHLDTLQKMAVALGKGVAFIEKRLTDNGLPKAEQQAVEEIAYRFYEKPLAIDNRLLLIEKISNACTDRNGFMLTAILDDASETVDDLLWMLDLMERYPSFRVKLLVNTAQISINFSSQMLADVLADSIFHGLVERLGKQFQVIKMYCPFISFQTSVLPPVAKQAILDSDLVFVKGANFFETCQIVEKDTIYAFVVFGPISRIYSGLKDYDPVFAYIPAGETGYVHDKDQAQIRTLRETVTKLIRANTL